MAWKEIKNSGEKWFVVLELGKKLIVEIAQNMIGFDTYEIDWNDDF
ncbi:hypothetical protein [Bacillus sp. REN10]|nr:hypothetical protein [Bacillus sp. REN10]